MKHTALMLLIIAFSCGCTHKPSTPEPQTSQEDKSLTELHTTKLAKERTWKVDCRIFANGLDSTYSISDTSFAIKVIDDKNIEMLGVPLKYITRKTHNFTIAGEVDTSIMLTYFNDNPSPHAGWVLYYFYKTDSVSYFTTSGGRSGFFERTYHAP